MKSVKQSEFVKKIKQASNTELDGMLQQERMSLYNKRQEIARKQLSNPQAIGLARKNVARIETEIRERELNAGKGS